VKVLITGATGFVGEWLQRSLTAAGHVVHPAPRSSELDIADVEGVRRLVAVTAPDTIAHLAAIGSAAEAARDPERAIRTNVGGTIAVIEAARAQDAQGRAPGVLVVSSAEVYGSPPSGRPLTEDAPFQPRHLYGMTKAGQEAVAIAGGLRYGLRVVVARPFNHTGPGQRPVAAAAAFVERVSAVRRGEATELAVGNLDVERDIGDVRDVVRAYRLLLEGMARHELADEPTVFNVATGTAVTLRWVVEELCRQARVRPTITVRPELLRPDDPQRLVGSVDALRDATGWRPEIPLAQTLGDMLADETGHFAGLNA
jgi:GDP-4-dehydro-6-deoxy-D-mannose reductase